MCISYHIQMALHFLKLHFSIIFSCYYMGLVWAKIKYTWQLWCKFFWILQEIKPMDEQTWHHYVFFTFILCNVCIDLHCKGLWYSKYKDGNETNMAIIVRYTGGILRLYMWGWCTCIMCMSFMLNLSHDLHFEPHSYKWQVILMEMENKRHVDIEK
jgi:hypothetical protein